MTTERKARKTEDALVILDQLNSGRVKTGQWLVAIRVGDEISQVDFARKLGISKAQLCDIEKGRKLVSPARAFRWGEILGYGGKQFMRSALQDMVQRELESVDKKLHIVITVE